MYRAVTWAALAAGLDPESTDSIAEWIGGPHAPTIISGLDPTDPTIEVDHVDVREPIRGQEVTANVSAISAVPEVRTFLVDLQRNHARAAAGGIIVEGRDIGSVVLPQADVKVFLTADPAVRAKRRAIETVEAVNDEQLAATESALRERDAKDSSRAVSPLTRAEGAAEIDTSDLTFDQVVDAVVELIDSARRS